MNKNCEECFALTLLLKNGLISEDAIVSDCPDIQSDNENIEVTSAIRGPLQNRLNFGDLPKEEEYTDMSNYECDNCEFLEKCQVESTCYSDPYVPCRKCEKHCLLKDGFCVVPLGDAYYANGRHPRAIAWVEDYFGSIDDLQNAIKRKEEKSKKYKEQNLSLFLFYDKGIEKIEPIDSPFFKNIYIFCLSNGCLYKNWRLIKKYQNSEHTECHNVKCEGRDTSET